MLTIKHVADSGNESVYPATEAGYTPAIGSNANGEPAPAFVYYTVPGSGEIKSIEGGTVYVMNDQGRTVATYRMSIYPNEYVAHKLTDDEFRAHEQNRARGY